MSSIAAAAAADGAQDQLAVNGVVRDEDVRVVHQAAHRIHHSHNAKSLSVVALNRSLCGLPRNVRNDACIGLLHLCISSRAAGIGYMALGLYGVRYWIVWVFGLSGTGPTDFVVFVNRLVS